MAEIKPQRVTWVDLARGVGILLVVIGHAAGGIIDSPLGTQAPVIRWVFLTIYTFHMPLFFILSGLFIAGRLKSAPEKFIKNSFTQIARTYLTWAFIQFTIIYMMGNMLNHPASGPYFPQIVAIIWTPVSQYWFLFSLFFMQIAAWLIVPRMGATRFLALASAAWLAYQVFGVPKWVVYPPLEQFLSFVISFAFGVAIGPHLSKIKALQDAKPVYALFAFLAWLCLYYAGYQLTCALQGVNWLLRDEGAQIAYIVNKYAFYPAALAGTATVILGCCANIVPARSLFEYMGRNSMAIFLTHILFIAGTRIVLLKLFKNIDINALVVVLSLIGIAGSLAFLEITKKLKVSKALALE